MYFSMIQEIDFRMEGKLNMSKGSIRHMFPGGNTAQGFFSYYDNILSQTEARRIIIIKGGPGVGKSTFMKKIAEEMLDQGYDVECMHCSSDNNSLDGIVIPKIKVAFMDGTAPHVVDPKNPGAVDEIIHLGDYWNEEGLRANREYILKDNREVGRQFARGYRYLKAAAQIYEDIKVINSWALDKAKVNEASDKIIKDSLVKLPVAKVEGKLRKLFASAITPDGLKCHLNTILDTKRIIVLKGRQGTDTEVVLENIKNAALARGLYVEAYYCTMDPQKVEHLYIPEIDTSFTTENDYHCMNINPYQLYDFDEFLNKEVLAEYAEVLKYNKDKYEELLKKAIDTISIAKKIHDQMERYYIPNMDFEAIQRCWEATMARVLEYAKEAEK